MIRDPARTFVAVLVAVHGFLAVWALVGFYEFFAATQPWPAVSNPLFPREILFMQWVLTLAAAGIFLGGYVLRWRYTPTAMACTYAAMAAVCAVQTMTYMQSEFRFVAMGLEYIAYAGILLFLFRSSLFRLA